MMRQCHARIFLLLAGFALAMLASGEAAAYMGPGAGLGMLSSVFAVIGAVLVAVFGILLWPLRLLLKRRRRTGPKA